MDCNCSGINALPGAILLGLPGLQRPLCALGTHASGPSLRSHGLVQRILPSRDMPTLEHSKCQPTSVMQSSWSRSRIGYFLGWHDLAAYLHNGDRFSENFTSTCTRALGHVSTTVTGNRVPSIPAALRHCFRASVTEQVTFQARHECMCNACSKLVLFLHHGIAFDSLLWKDSVVGHIFFPADHILTPKVRQTHYAGTRRHRKWGGRACFTYLLRAIFRVTVLGSDAQQSVLDNFFSPILIERLNLAV
jgi:hypothetical protein